MTIIALDALWCPHVSLTTGSARCFHPSDWTNVAIQLHAIWIQTTTVAIWGVLFGGTYPKFAGWIWMVICWKIPI